MVLAAGRGERMRPLSDSTPKPLLPAGGLPLIDYHLRALAAAGIGDVVINLSWLGGMVREHVGDGRRFGLRVRFSDEGPVPLEAGGGIYRALPWLGPDRFLVVNGDVWTDFPLHALGRPAGSLAHILLVPNPEHHPAGDFALDASGQVTSSGPRLTYAGIGLFDPALFAGCVAGRFPLKPLLERARAAGQLTGEAWPGHWFDVGTPERLAALDGAIRRGECRHPSAGSMGGRQRGPPG